jgi:hypothetical protein
VWQNTRIKQFPEKNDLYMSNDTTEPGAGGDPCTPTAPATHDASVAGRLAVAHTCRQVARCRTVRHVRTTRILKGCSCHPLDERDSRANPWACLDSRGIYPVKSRDDASFCCGLSEPGFQSLPSPLVVLARTDSTPYRSHRELGRVTVESASTVTMCTTSRPPAPLLRGRPVGPRPRATGQSFSTFFSGRSQAL